MIAIIDVGLGNVGSVANMLSHVGVESRMARVPDDLDGADRIIMPGVGSFDRGMQLLERTGFRSALDGLVGQGVPVLGICLGFQLMGRRSEEGTRAGLGWLGAETRSFDATAIAAHDLRLPHIGWNNVMVVRSDPLMTAPRQRFYFVHGYHVVCDAPTEVVAEAEHGVRFTAMARHGNLVGVQFHPEKSHRYGMDFLKRFAGQPA